MARRANSFTVHKKRLDALEKSNRPEDSGWRFFSGEETQAYVDNPNHTMIYDINMIANYDPAIVPYLSASTGSAFCARGSEVSLGSLSKNLLVERQLGNCFSKLLILFVKLLQLFDLILTHATVSFAPSAALQPSGHDRLTYCCKHDDSVHLILSGHLAHGWKDKSAAADMEHRL